MQYHFKHSPHKLLIALLCCTALFVGSSSISLGNSRQTPAANFGLLPYDPSHLLREAYFVINAHPGERLQEQMYVTNTGNVAGTARLTPVDATTAQMGGAVYLSSSQAQHNVGTWITPNVQQVTLAPNQKEIVQFQVTVPKDARSGQHYGGIVAQNMTLQHAVATKGKSNFQVTIEHITIITVEVITPGPQMEQMVAKGIQIGGFNKVQTLLIGLQNTGNAKFKSTGTLQITDTNGTILQKSTFSINTFLPQTSINFPVNVKGKAIGVGSYLASLTLNYGSGHILNYATTFTVTQQQLEQVFGAPPGLQTPWGTISLPLWAIILIALVAGIILFVGGQKTYGLIMARRRKKAKGAHEQADDHDKPTDISHKRGNKIA